jgi:hypothetical protein
MQRIVVAVGVVVSLAPAIWYSVIWPGQPDATDWKSWIGLALYSCAPFLLLAVLYERPGMGRVATGVALAVSTVLVVAGQYASLNPNDSSLSSAFTMIVEPFLACVVVLLALAISQLYRRWSRQVRTPT